MIVPDPMVGAWERVGLELDGAVVDDTTTVRWLQAPELFADLRVDTSTGGVVGCFAGTALWRPPHLCWTRQYDLSGTDLPPDEGEVHWEGEVLVETGVFPFPGTDGPVPYVERWRRLGGDRPVHAWAVPGGVLVRAGAHSLGVALCDGVLSGCYRTLEAGTWTVVLQHGDGAEAVPEPPRDDTDEPAWSWVQATSAVEVSR